MSDFTPRANLRLPGGGSTGTILPDEQVDIDVLNDNFRKVDALLGARNVPSVSSYSGSMDGDLVYARDTELLSIYDANVSALRYPRVLGGTRFSGTQVEMTAFTGARDGDSWFNTTDNTEYLWLSGAWVAALQKLTPSFGAGFTSRGHTITYDVLRKTVEVSFNARHSSVPTNGAVAFTIPGVPNSVETRYFPGIAAEAGTPIPCFVRIAGATVTVWQTNSTAAASGSVYGASFSYTTL